MAVAIMLVFLYKNDKWLTIPLDDLYKLAKLVVESGPSINGHVINKIKEVLKEFSTTPKKIREQ